ncbi:MAG: glycoside hydrolase family 44 protein [Myxococcota bacterium]
MSVPQRLNLTREERDARLAGDARLTRGLGATYVRGHTGAFPRVSMSEIGEHAEEGDVWVRVVQDAGLEAVMMVSPWPANRTANHTARYFPDDLAAYEAYVRALVERYDGDGVDDAPGLRAPVRYWEVDNEPDLKFTNPPRGAVRDVEPGTFCKPDEYARVLVASARAIRAAYPDAKVLGAGLYRPHAESGVDYLRALAGEPGVRDALDVLSLHTYADDDGGRLAAGIRNARGVLPDLPVWVTETSAPGEDEAQQARRVVALAARAAVEGAERLFWHTLADPPARAKGGGPEGLRTHSLFRASDDGSLAEKPAAATFRHLAAVLGEHDLAGAVDAGPGVVRLRDGSRLLYAGTAAGPGVDLRDGTSIPAGETAEAPAFLVKE